jgi:glycosyltransferase involved in cell wall biosynthesis
MAVAYIVRSYPRLSQTFILNEILALERLGLAIEIFGMSDPGEPLVQSGVARVKAPAYYLDVAARRPLAKILAEHVRVAARAPRRYAATAVYALVRRDLDRGYTTASRFACFAQAVYLARLLRSRTGAARIVHLHSHFAHDPTLIALLVKRLTGLPYSFTAHARDLYETPVRTLAERAQAATAVVTCCGANADYLRRVVPAAGGKVRVIHHGVDATLFRPGRRTPSSPPLVLSAGRLVEKKGFGDLLRACALLAPDVRGRILGDGPMCADLARLVAELGLEERVELGGGFTQADLARELGRAAVFALTPVVMAAGDRDGIPNVLLEAMAAGVPVVATDVGGIPEVVVDGRTGLLCPAGDVERIASSLASLVADHRLRVRLGRAARAAVVERFDAQDGARRIADVLYEREVS